MRWLVEEIIEAETPGQSPIIRLACADDDAQGQAADVFWDYELDRRILEGEGWGNLAAKREDDRWISRGLPGIYRGQRR